jgi:hypothetical protein
MCAVLLMKSDKVFATQTQVIEHNFWIIETMSKSAPFVVYINIFFFRNSQVGKVCGNDQ